MARTISVLQTFSLIEKERRNSINIFRMIEYAFEDFLNRIVYDKMVERQICEDILKWITCGIDGDTLLSEMPEQRQIGTRWVAPVMIGHVYDIVGNCFDSRFCYCLRHENTVCFEKWLLAPVGIGKDGSPKNNLTLHPYTRENSCAEYSKRDGCGIARVRRIPQGCNIFGENAVAKRQNVNAGFVGEKTVGLQWQDVWSERFSKTVPCKLNSRKMFRIPLRHRIKSMWEVRGGPQGIKAA